MPPTVVDEQPLTFVRWAPGLASAADHIRKQKQRAAQATAETPQQTGPRFNGGMG